MDETRMTATEADTRPDWLRRALNVWPGLVALAAFLGYLATPLLPNSVLASDARIYADRVDSILDGNLPYFDVLYEHLPLGLPPMLAPRLVPGSERSFVYVLIFGLIMVACLILLGRAVGKLADDAGTAGGAERWAALALPLVPLVAFRLDPLPTLLAVVALRLAFARAGWGSMWAGIGAIAAKGWPVVLAPIEWWAGRRRQAMVWAVFAVALGGGLLLTPGFQEGRDFSGIHLETVAGSVIALVSSLFGSGADLAVAAGATYVAAPTWVLAVGPALAATLLWGTRRLWRAEPGPGSGARLAGVLTLALLLASPLLSAQFLLWLTPWLIFFGGRRLPRLFVGVGLVTLGLLAFWGPANVWWQLALAGRNLLLLAVAWELVRAAKNSRVSSTS